MLFSEALDDDDALGEFYVVQIKSRDVAVDLQAVTPSWLTSQPFKHEGYIFVHVSQTGLLFPVGNNGYSHPVHFKSLHLIHFKSIAVHKVSLKHDP